MSIFLGFLASIFLILWLMKFFVIATKDGVTQGSLGCLDVAGFWALCYFAWGI